MAIRRAAVILAALAGMIPPGPVAHAAGASIVFNFNPSFTHKAGGGYLAGSFCRAEAKPGTMTQVALATQVTCSINGTTRSSAMPGGVAAVSILVATAPPVMMCATGKATFMETENDYNEIVLVEAGPICQEMPI